MHALEIHNLTKSFGSLRAVDDVSFEVPEGSIFGLIGRNGAGKTTTIRMLMNIYRPDSGEVVFRGNRIGQEIKNIVGYLPEERGLYLEMLFPFSDKRYYPFFNSIKMTNRQSYLRILA
jgi:ABC-2 type transport system ATP-binding protein